MLTLVFKCGCKVKSYGEEEQTPKCEKHGERIERVIAPPPKFSGSVKRASR